MNKKLWRVFAGLCALAMSAVWALPVSAQMSEAKEKPPMYSYVSFWNIPRAQWADMAKADDTDRKILDKAIANRSVVAAKNIERYRGLNGRISAHVMRFEHLIADFRQFALGLGIDYRLPLPHAKKGILANGIDPRDLLNRQQITLINELFDEEFETFHYERA